MLFTLTTYGTFRRLYFLLHFVWEGSEKVNLNDVDVLPCFKSQQQLTKVPRVCVSDVLLLSIQRTTKSKLNC